MDENTGAGAALDAGIAVEETAPPKITEADVAALRAKVDRQREHLAGAEAALSAAEAALAAQEG